LNTLFAEVHQVHFVHGQHHVFDAQQGHQVGVTAGLGDHALGGIDEDDGQVGGGGTGDHVAGVLFVSGTIGNDEFPPVCAEVTVGHIDGDALFAFGFESVEQEGIVDILACMAHAFAVALECCQLVFVNHFTVEHQSANQRGFAVVDRSGRKDAEEVFLFVLVKEGQNGPPLIPPKWGEVRFYVVFR
jgi:hypothetical protein